MRNKNLNNLLIVFILCGCTIHPTLGQLAIIQDEDGYVNVRKGASTKSEIVNRLFYGDVFLYLEEQGENWYQVYFSLDEKDAKKSAFYSKIRKEKGSIARQGYIHKSRVLPIDELVDIADRQSGNDIVSLRNKEIEITFYLRNFLPENHKISYHKDNPAFISQIDGKWPRGVDGGVPTREIHQIEITWAGRHVEIPRSDYLDLFQPSKQGISLKKYKGFTYLTMLGNSDGAGGYDCVWIFKDGMYMGRYVDAP